MPGQTVQIQIRLILIKVYTVCHFVRIVWTHYSMVEPHSLNFRVITTNLGNLRYVNESQQNLGQGLLERKTALSLAVIYY